MQKTEPVKKTIAIIGGDARSVALHQMFAGDGHDVRAYALEKAIPCENSLHGALAGAHFAVGPTPCSRDGLSVHAPLSDKLIPLPLLASALKERLLFAGSLDNARRHFPNAVDLLCLPQVAMRNAVPTAEGAILLALQEADITLFGAHCLVLGNGRIGKALSARLAALHARVTVAARGAEDRALCEVLGTEAVSFGKDFCPAVAKADFIFNTVPERVLEGALPFCKKGALYIELASPPYGTETSQAQQAGLTYIMAQGLPGKCAPRSAAGYLRQAIYRALQEPLPT